MREVEYSKIQTEHKTLVDIKGNNYEGEFTYQRIVKDSIPAHLHVYECRHEDEGSYDTPATIEDRVIVNFCGTFLTDTKIHYPDKMDHCIILR
jgi:hypothetical protein